MDKWIRVFKNNPINEIMTQPHYIIIPLLQSMDHVLDDVSCFTCLSASRYFKSTENWPKALAENSSLVRKNSQPKIQSLPKNLLSVDFFVTNMVC